jgi:hypothetical protein
MIQFLKLLDPQRIAKIVLFGSIAVLALFAFIQTMKLDRVRKDLTICAQARKNYVTTTNLETEKLERAAVEQKVRIETRYVKVKDASETAIRNRLERELDSLRRAKATRIARNDVKTDLPVTTSPATDIDGTSQVTVMDDDKERCTAAVVKAQGWQEFYKGLSL